MNGLGLILLHMLRRINGDRTISGCYHILKGKKSGQAIQDSALFRYKSWFGVFPHLDIQAFQDEIKSLLRNGLIKKISSSINESEDKHFCVLSPEGIKLLERKEEHFRINERGFLLEEHRVSITEAAAFWKKIQLLSQVLSFTINQIPNYSPIIDDVDIQEKFKHFWVNIDDKQAFSIQLRHELVTYFDRFEDPLFPELITSRLSGYRVTGLTYAQLEHLYRVPVALIQLYLYQGVGYLLHQIKKHRNSCLYALSLAENSNPSLTASAKKTFEMLKMGVSVDNIAKDRGLKKSTIEDHIIEITIHDSSFDVSPFLSNELLSRIKQVSRKLHTNKLSLIMQGLHHEVSYFQIRLALLKLSGDMSRG